MTPVDARDALDAEGADGALDANGAPDGLDEPGAIDADNAPDSDIAVEAGTAPDTKRRLRRPRRYQVVVHNDDYTTMEFVVAMLMKHFHKPPAEAMHVMLLVHHQGAGIAGVYSRDVAETKVAEVIDEAREEGMPLLLTAEPLAPDETNGTNDPDDREDRDGAGGVGPRGERR